MIQKPSAAVSGVDPLPVIDDSELDIADYLREEADPPPAVPQGFAALTIGAVGVVYGDIGTSPIYAFREALRPVAADGLARAEVLGLLSLLIWTLTLIVTVKYVLFLLRTDNRGEGGVLALYTLARLAIGRRSLPVLALAVAGAALFAGDAIITPAISVLSAVEGAGLILPDLAEWVVPVTLGIILALFLVQRRGTGAMSLAFGPVTALWFLTLGALGLWHILANPGVLAAVSPTHAVFFLLEHQTVAFLVLGAVFLAVTGAEALYADLGHFGRKPIITAWIALVMPALILNYLGQGALVLSDPAAIDDPFFRLVPEAWLPALVLIATAATVIAAQAVISGAFSMTRAAVQLGLLPRLTIRHTSHDQSGQIYIGAVNWMLLVGVIALVLSFGSSAALASAYGIAVTGTMVVTTLLAIVYVTQAGKLPLPLALLLAAPILLLELAFLASNLTKLHDGGYVPVLLAALLMLAMLAWWRGSQQLLAHTHRQAIALDGFAASMLKSSAPVVPGTAFFLTPDPTVVPSALLHNLKHNRVLHDQNVLVTVETLRIPVADPEDRASYEVINPRFARLTLRFGFMETPNVTRAMAHARKAGLKFDVMASSFFLGKRRPVVTGPIGLDRLLDNIFALLSRFSADPSDFYHLPRNRVVELGERVAV
ncbi:potassium transporter Kup [Tabrizicola sp. TH137]|uniref:potassium transporter Kup n=1 Tax=Tabrizicola sp. TH137 TaxID=2067452 RepID=UPI000C7A1F29|nr:potassium transporter Kup [Tabrizicola sp. TH137]PLL14196.1 potassium transporter Kup [Tabrizicola sp. TH137]